eukprot:GHVR01076064.1.p1 GENE.GHVR01076064.1~~GHVR01076064.1.p1  ORF type:complete len:220 (+),score=62.18 GHVR01076064.1:281-940(+)
MVLLRFAPSGELSIAAKEAGIKNIESVIHEQIGRMIGICGISGCVCVGVCKCLGVCILNNNNIKSSYGSKNDLVHWCHGAPGWVSLACHWSVLESEKRGSSQVTGRESATAIAEVVWQRGLLKKGLGLCHGIGGNGYALLTMYRHTRDISWLHKAQMFAAFGVAHEEELVGVPDRPLSLYEGVAGFASFLASLAAHLDAHTYTQDTTKQTFWGMPGWEW